jgi:putative copper export protein/methionine-rich copper-binding protein CopC
MRRVVLAVAGVLLVVLSTVGFGRVASAHTELESASPAPDSTATAAVTSISLTFTQAVTPAEPAIQLFDEQGRPVAVGPVTSSPDGATITTTLPQPTGNGRFGVLWQIVSTDGHTLSDSFEFVVDAPVPTTTTPPPTTTTTTPPTTVAPATTPETTEATKATTAPTTVTRATTVPATAAPGITTPTPTTMPDTTLIAGGDDGNSGGHGDGSALDEALHDHTHGANAWWSTPARIMLVGGAVLAIGVVIFALTCLGASGRDRGVLIGTARVAGIVVAVGAVLDLLAHSEALGGGIADGLSDVLRGSLGTAEGLRVAGGLALALSWASSTATWELLDRDDEGAAGLRYIPTLAAFGVLALLVSFAFDGHTVSEGPRVVHAAVNSVHVGAAAVWTGGVFAFGVVAVRSRLRSVTPRAVGAAVIEPAGVDERSASLAPETAEATARVLEPRAIDTLAVGLRFSSIATVALVAVAAAGIVMTLFILPSFESLWNSSWGRTLLVKVGATTLAALMGGFNHFVLLPRLRTDPEDETVRETIRTVVLCEAVMLAIVVVVTAYLVNANPG